MPKINTHIHLALKVSKKINIHDIESFVLSNAYPDYVDRLGEYHYKDNEDSECNLQKFLEIEELNDFNLGYYFHLWTY